MKKEHLDMLTALIQHDFIAIEDIPKIELYMDQVTSFLDSHLESLKRYPDDKIMTKTMINNYTKNHLLPVSNKKRYSKEHLYLILMIYYLKNMLSISDIKELIGPLGTEYFKTEDGQLNIEQIYDTFTSKTTEESDNIQTEIQSSIEGVQGLFHDKDLSPEQEDYLNDLSAVFRLSYDIFLRKKMIEKIIDNRREGRDKNKESCLQDSSAAFASL